MSQSAGASVLEDCEFKWGKKRGIGGRKKEVQFYESFSYDSTEYSLYDSVYLYKEGEPEPYIGKLVKIYEQQQKKKVKVLWFFRPVEILNWLQDGKTLENEIILASGDGKGLADINPLEAIAGKCNVVCTSKDSRNPQPSPEELRTADFIFYRTFDVKNYTVSDKIDEQIAGLDVKFLLNRKEEQQSNDVLEAVTEKKEGNGNAIASHEASQSSPKLSPQPLEDDTPGQNPLPGKDLVSDTSTKTKETKVSTVAQEHATKVEPLMDSPSLEKCSAKEDKPGDKASKPSNGTALKATSVIKKGAKCRGPKHQKIAMSWVESADMCLLIEELSEAAQPRKQVMEADVCSSQFL